MVSNLGISGVKIEVVKVLCFDEPKRRVYFIRKDDGFNGSDESDFDSLNHTNQQLSQADIIAQWKRYAIYTINADGELK